MNKETAIQNEIRVLSSKVPGLRLFRNNVGLYWGGRLLKQIGRMVTLDFASRVKCGLAEGSGDLIGWQSITITPEMVGKQVAIFTSIEVKQPGKKARDNQDKWIKAVIACGGIAGVATSHEEARGIIENFTRTISERR